MTVGDLIAHPGPLESGLPPESAVAVGSLVGGAPPDPAAVAGVVAEPGVAKGAVELEVPHEEEEGALVDRESPQAGAQGKEALLELSGRETIEVASVKEGRVLGREVGRKSTGEKGGGMGRDPPVEAAQEGRPLRVAFEFAQELVSPCTARTDELEGGRRAARQRGAARGDVDSPARRRAPSQFLPPADAGVTSTTHSQPPSSPSSSSSSSA